jgi:YaiO family outer membrane protein
MWSRIFRNIYIPLLLCLFFGDKANGQGRNDTTVVITDTTNIEALFRRARDMSRDGNYSQARRIFIKILERKPSYYEVRTSLGRTYAWEKQYDNARTELSRVLIEKENDFEALNALFDVEFWTESYSVANDYLKVALGYYPTSEELLLKKAKLQIKMEEKNEAALTLRRILDLNPGQKEAIRIMNSLEGRKLNNNFQTSYVVDLFDNPQRKGPQQQYSAEYGHNFSFGSLTGRVNYGDKFNRQGFQYELESYPHITKSTYLDLLAGYSDVSIYPSQKYLAEIYQKLPAGFEMSFGMRYLKFTNVTTIYSASLSNYFKDYWFSVRTYITPKDSSAEVREKTTAVTILGNIRIYFGDSDNYLGIRGGRGSSADENLNLNIQGYPTVQAAAEIQRRTFGRWLMKLDFTFARESPRNGEYIQRYSTQITLKTVF